MHDSSSSCRGYGGGLAYSQFVRCILIGYSQDPHNMWEIRNNLDPFNIRSNPPEYKVLVLNVGLQEGSLYTL